MQPYQQAFLEFAIDQGVLRYGEFTLAQMLDSFIIWHINAHCGEISALKGCQGLTGYPW